MKNKHNLSYDINISDNINRDLYTELELLNMDMMLKMMSFDLKDHIELNWVH